MMVTFTEDNLMTFRHLFLKGYKDHHSGSYALYTKSDVYDHIFFIIDKVLTGRAEKKGSERPQMNLKENQMLLSFQYVSLQNLTVGNLAYELVDGDYAPLSVCQELYRKSHVYPGNDTFDIDPRTDKGT